MLVTDLQARSARAPNEGQRVVLHGVSWQDFERLLAIRRERAGVRMTYLEGELPDVDLTLAARCLLQAASQAEAVKTYLAALGR